MRRAFLLFMTLAILATAAAPALAIQCVPYAREVSGINLKGDAWEWWHAASGVYERGRAPKDGAVLVFSRQGSMQHGHVSVVTRVVSNRLVLVDHANWAPVRGAGRGQVTRSVPVLDVSPRNDWSQVRVWFRPANDYGNRVYKAEGFVYNTGIGDKAAKPHLERAALTRAAALFPNDKALGKYAEPATSPAQPVTAVAPKTEAKPQTVADSAVSHPSSDDLVKVARHVFRPRETQPTRASASDFIFN